MAKKNGHTTVSKLPICQEKESKAGKKFLIIEAENGEKFLSFENEYSKMTNKAIQGLIFSNDDSYFQVDWSWGTPKDGQDPPRFLDNIFLLDESAAQAATNIQEIFPGATQTSQITQPVEKKTPINSKPQEPEKDWDLIQLRKDKAYVSCAIIGVWAARINSGVIKEFDLEAMKKEADEVVKYIQSGK